MVKPNYFDEEYLTNPVWHEQPTGMLPPECEYIGRIPHGTAVARGIAPSPGVPVETGFFPQPNGDMLFRIYAPNVNKVELHLLNMEPRPNIVLEKGADGVHEGVFPFDPTFTGATDLDVIYDGTTILHPRFPIFWHRNRPVNFIELPEKESEWVTIRKVPHGSVTRELFWSELFQCWQRCMVYTPPGYEKGGSYPILYLQAGGGENETTWEYNGRFTHITDNMLAEGACVPMIICVTDGSVVYPNESGRGGSIPGFEDMLLQEVIPFVEGKYRVLPGKFNRAISGLSRGGHQSFAIALTHPDMFGYIGVFSAYMFHKGDPGEEYYNKALLDDPERFEREFKIFFRCMGQTDHLFPEFAQDNQFFEERGLTNLSNYRYAEYPNKSHLWGTWRLAFHDFIQMIFKD